jgi:DNA polymerase-1
MDFTRVPIHGASQEQYLDSDNSISLEDFLEKARVVPEIAVDTETNKQDVRDGRGFATGVSIAYNYPGLGRLSHYLPFRHKVGQSLEGTFRRQLQDILEFRAANGLPVIYHNSKFDIPSLGTLGIDLTGSFHYCTMLITHLIDENLYSDSLDSVAKHFLHDQGKLKSDLFKKIEKAYGWENIPSEVMYEYAAYDADLTLRVWEHIKPMFFAEKLHEYWPHKLHTIEVVTSMERHGVKIDVPLCEQMSFAASESMLDVVELLDLNPGSPKDLKTLLLDKLGLPILKRSQKTGNPSFDKEVMLEYDEILERRQDPTSSLILSYRGWQKSKSSNYDPYVKLLSPDGRLRPNYKLHGTKTGRFSCVDPNLQQIPKSGVKPWNGKMKKAFIEDEGWELWEGDYSQLEFRLTAAVANETHLLEVFADDERDVFNEMAQRIGLVRQDTKTFVYATGYGAGINKIHHSLGVTPQRAQQIRSQYWAQYPGIKTISDAARNTVIRDGKIRLWSGRYRHFQWPKTEGHKALNSWVQGGAADIVERTMWRLYEGVESEYCHMLLQVHDSIVFAIRSDMRDKVLPEIKRIMEAVEPDFGVRFKTDIHRWAE